MSSKHFYRPAEGHRLAHDPFNAIIAPRPIGWISSRSNKGLCNLAPYSFFNAFNYIPPIIGFSSIGRKDSLTNIEETGVFGWNLVSKNLAASMNASCLPVAPDINEFELAELSSFEGSDVDVPLVSEAFVNFECKLSDIVQLKAANGQSLDTWLVLGEVVGIHINKDLIEEGVYSTVAAEPILRGGGAGDYFTVTEDSKFIMKRPD